MNCKIFVIIYYISIYLDVPGMECVLRQFHASNSVVGSINTDTSDKSAISDLFVAELVDTALTVSSQTLQRSTNVKHSSVFPRPCRADTVPAKSEKYRFPLIDGTLFVSPILYDPKKGVSSLISNKKQFIYGICLNCLSATDPDHKIECSFCHKPWLNGRTLQIGSLIKPSTNPLLKLF